MVVTVQREFMTVFEQLRQGDPDQSRGGKTTDFDAHLLHDLAKEWIERDMPVEWKELDMSEETRSQFQKMGIELMSLIAKVQIYETNRKDIGIDMGKSNIATAVYQDTSLQRVHAPMRKQKMEDRFKTLSIPNKAWRDYSGDYSGQMAYPFLMKKRIKKFVPNLDSRPTTKTTNTESIIEPYRFMNNQWENGTDAVLFFYFFKPCLAESGGGMRDAFFINELFGLHGRDEGWMCFQVEVLQKPMGSNNLEQGYECWNQHVQFAQIEHRKSSMHT
ncbi:hypothetical protein M9434_006539 [Picochlorum sp. BPE23]|nr:hypothetical protein M9434_006539 [Picochlorum sp. BPE23]